MHKQKFDYTMKKLYAFVFTAAVTLSVIEGSITVSAQLVYKDVAGIFYSRCTGCHHLNGGAPFSMMNYSETYPWASWIQTDLNTGKMPPWSPDTTYSRFLHERVITTSEKNAILTWISNGAQKGDTTLAPPAPTYTKYHLSGTPDLVLQIPTFSSNGGAADVYDCFALPTGLSVDRVIRAFEVVPGNPAIVHHVVVKVDTTGTVTNDLSGGCFSQPGDFDLDVYAPGGAPTVFPGQAPLKIGIRLKAGSKMILQIHYPPGTAGQLDSTQIRLYFYPLGTTGIRPVYVNTLLQNWTMPILPNTTPTFTAKYPSSGGLTTAYSIFGAFPHSHTVCKTMTNWADNGTTTIPLIKINSWDFAWQGFYTYKKMPKIPTGYTIRASHLFDNTTNNPNNPNNPPALVMAGTGTKDEMLFDSFQYLLYQAGDELIDIGNLLANDTLLTTSVNEQSPMRIQSFAYPNPFNEYVKIGYELTHPAETAVSVYNIYGSEVKNLAYQYNAAGDYTVNWDGKNNEGVKLPAGIYFYTICAGNSTASGKIALMPR
ncbi:MAG: T9SS type A sorting domain-containing protein [Bacteroidetes bacterium]|nr:MAG: T9SS type A sorting domain-containing protein [Bacteroidota bacterium]